MQAALDGAARGGVHHPLDDLLARRRLHPRALHGRHHRQAVPRVRRHDRRGDSRVRRRLAHAHADARAAASSGRATARSRGGSTRTTERLYERWLHGYERSLAWVMARRRATLVFSAVILVAHRRAVRGRAQGALSRPTTPASSSAPPKRPRASRSTRSWSTSSRSPPPSPAAPGRPLGHLVGRHDRRREPGAAHDRPQAALRAQDGAPPRSRASSRSSRSTRPDITLFVQNPPAISIGGLASKSLYQYTLLSGDIDDAQSRRPRAGDAAARSSPRSPTSRAIC